MDHPGGALGRLGAAFSAAVTASPAQELVTVRFRQGFYTWLIAYGSTPPADVDVALMVARALASKAADPA